MIVRILHFIGLTNLSDEQVEEYHRRPTKDSLFSIYALFMAPFAAIFIVSIFLNFYVYILTSEQLNATRQMNSRFLAMNKSSISNLHEVSADFVDLETSLRRTERKLTQLSSNFERLFSVGAEGVRLNQERLRSMELNIDSILRLLVGAPAPGGFKNPGVQNDNSIPRLEPERREPMLANGDH